MKLRQLGRKTILPAIAFALALFVGGLVIGFTDSRVLSKISSPISFIRVFASTVGNAYLALFQGAIFDPNLAEGHSLLTGFYPLSQTMVNAAPLMLCGLSVAIAFKAGLFNIGAQGQFILGAIGASYVGFHYQLPIVVHIIVAIVAAIVLSALWGGFVGLLKAKTGAHEVIVTIMLNYIAANFLLWLLGTTAFLRPGRLDPLAPPIKESARLLRLFGDNYSVNVGIFISIFVAFLFWLLINRSTWGFKTRAVGANSSAARTAGISVQKITIGTMLIAGALSGLAGAIHVLGFQYELTSDVAGSFGFDAITVALLGRGGPVGVVLASLLFAGLRVGGTTMQANVQVPVEIVLVIQALVVLFIAAPGLISRYLKIKNLESGQEMASKGWNG
jgi:general nucleoside transport system permease protein